MSITSDAIKAIKDAYFEGFFARDTYNDAQLNDENETFSKSFAKSNIDGLTEKLGSSFDYRKMLKAYIEHVRECEGTSFLWELSVDGLSSEEMAEIRKIDKKG